MGTYWLSEETRKGKVDFREPHLARVGVCGPHNEINVMVLLL